MKTMKNFRRAICAALLAIVCYSPLQAQELVIDENNYEEYLVYVENANPENGRADWVFKDKSVLKGVKKLTISGELYSYLNLTTGAEDLEELVIDKCFFGVFVHGTKLRKVTIDVHPRYSLFDFQMDNGFLSQDSIILRGAPFYRFIAKRQRITDLTPIYPLLWEDCDELQLNGGKYNRNEMGRVVTYNPTNSIREIDMTRIPSKLKTLHLATNLLERIDNINQPLLNNLMLRNNLLWSLDLSSLTITSPLGNPNYAISDGGEGRCR